jgi:hypothetical protein
VGDLKAPALNTENVRKTHNSSVQNVLVGKDKTSVMGYGLKYANVLKDLGS